MTTAAPIPCRPLPPFPENDWRAVEAAFSDAPAAALEQTWLATPDPGFRAGVVRFGQRDRTLWLLADLADDDIFNDEQRFNEFFFLHGDVFEIFLRPEGQRAYFEFHVGPQNQRLQLRIPSAEAFATAASEELDTWRVAEERFRSWTLVEPENRRWRVLVAIPFESVLEPGASSESWLISCSRYDYTRGGKKPVLSSTSAHRSVGFHTQEDWRRLQFRD